jgi:hypothetical protein
MPWAWAWWTAVAFVAGSLLVVLVFAWADQDPRPHVEAVAGLIGLVALVAGGAAVLLAAPQYREWAAEYRRYADFDLWIELAQVPDAPGTALDAICSETDLPDRPMFVLQNETAIVRACVHVKDRFPLRNTTINIVVPTDCNIDAWSTTGKHVNALTVTANERVNPNDTHGVRWTSFSGDLSPRGYTAITAELRPLTDAPFRLMAELSCTPAPAAEAEGFRFALIAPRDWPGMRDVD